MESAAEQSEDAAATPALQTTKGKGKGGKGLRSIAQPSEWSAQQTVEWYDEQAWSLWSSKPMRPLNVSSLKPIRKSQIPLRTISPMKTFENASPFSAIYEEENDIITCKACSDEKKPNADMTALGSEARGPLLGSVPRSELATYASMRISPVLTLAMF